MVPLGSKALFALAALTFLGGVGVGAANGDKVATLGLCFIGTAAFVLAIAVVLADSDRAPWVAPDAPWAQQQPVGGRPARPSVWPLAAGLGFTCVAAALASNAIFGLGAGILLLIAGPAWLLQHWSEQPTYSSAFARRLRERFLLPFGIPVGVMALVALIALSLSRVFLALPENGTRATALAVAVVIVAGAFTVAASQRMARTAMILLSGFAMTCLIAAGVVSALHGVRKTEKPQLVSHYAPLPGQHYTTTTVAGAATTTTAVGETTTTVLGYPSTTVAASPTTTAASPTTTAAAGAPTTVPASPTTTVP